MLPISDPYAEAEKDTSIGELQVQRGKLSQTNSKQYLHLVYSILYYNILCYVIISYAYMIYMYIV